MELASLFYKISTTNINRRNKSNRIVLTLYRFVSYPSIIKVYNYLIVSQPVYLDACGIVYHREMCNPSNNHDCTFYNKKKNTLIYVTK